MTKSKWEVLHDIIKSILKFLRYALGLIFETRPRAFVFTLGLSISLIMFAANVSLSEIVNYIKVLGGL